jgi:DNA-binding NarL/FixJ family response regulator
MDVPVRGTRQPIAVFGGDPFLCFALTRALGAADVLRERVVLDGAGADVAVVVADVDDARALAEARRAHPEARLVLVGPRRDDHDGYRADDVVLHRSCSLADVIAAVAAALRPRPQAIPSPLSARQREILGLLVEGCPPKEAALRLGITTNTCRTHLRRAREALACTSTMQAISEAMRRGWLDPPQP